MASFDANPNTGNATQSLLATDYTTNLCDRLYTLLPVSSDQTAAEIELDPQFLVTKRLILHGAKRYVRKPTIPPQILKNGESDEVEVDDDSDSEDVQEQIDSEFISNIFLGLCKLIESIESKDSSDVPQNTNEKIVGSLLFICKLLADIIRHIWTKKRTVNKNFSFLPQSDASSTTSESLSGAASSSSSSDEEINPIGYAIAPHNFNFATFTKPKKLNPSSIAPIIDVLVGLISSNATSKVLATVKSSSDPKYNIGTDNASTTASTTAYTLNTTNTDISGQLSDNLDMLSLNTDELTSYVDEIDSHLEVIFRFLATANPTDFTGYLNAKVISYAKMGDLIPLPVLQRYSPLFQYVYYDEVVTEELISDIYNALPFIKSNSWKQVLLVFFSQGMKSQWFARPEEYERIFQPYSKLEVTCKNLFDYVSTIFEDAPFSGCSSTVQSSLLVLCVSDFMELDSKPNKLRIAFNKRLKFLTSIMRDARTCSNLESFESLIHIFYLAARLPFDLHNHPIYKFTLVCLDETYENLNKLVISFNTAEASSLYDGLVVDFYIAAIMVKPQKYMDVLINKFTESHESIKEVRILVKIVKGLSELERTATAFHTLMETLSPHLKSMIFGAFKILNQYETNTVGLSADSIHSDKFSVDSDQKSRYATHFTSKKTNLDHYLQEIASPGLKSPDIHQTDDLLAKTITKSSANFTGSHGGTFPSNISLTQNTITSSSSLSSGRNRLVVYTEEIMADLFAIFIACPELYFIDNRLMREEVYDQDPDGTIKKLTQFSNEVTVPLKYAFQAKGNHDSNLFDSASTLALTLIERSESIELSNNNNFVAVYANFLESNLILESIGDAALTFHLTDSKFKSIFFFLTHFLQARAAFLGRITRNRILETDVSHKDCLDVCKAMEKTLVMALCTHDIQFYSMAKITMKWHIFEIEHGNHLPHCFHENLAATFLEIVNDDTVFTGFVSLHKRVRNFLRVARPTSSLYSVWVLIYHRWLEMLESKSINDESLVFRHFTGFLVSVSGCFLQEEFSRDDPDQKSRAKAFVSEFFDKAISLLTSPELVVRVVVKDTLSNESHSAVYHLICTKLMAVGHEYAETKIVSEESILFIEQCIVVVTAMMNVDNDGAFVLVSLMPGVCEFFIRFINMIPGELDKLRIKLRFCKLGTTIEHDRFRVGLSGAFKLRNFYAKASAEWLEQAVFYDELNGNKKEEASSSYLSKFLKESEITYLNIDLANECSKALQSQLEDIILEIPDGTKDKELRKYKDIAFGSYFSIFYKILQKYASNELPPKLAKSKFKIQSITDNVLKCTSNILQFDTDIGMQFVLPLGYHENNNIRALFLDVFANMLSTRKLQKEKVEFADDVITRLADLYEIFGATAEVASSTEHNLLASSLFAVFSYSKKLDKLFNVLLNDEISVVSRSTDIFRRNSTLTRLLSNFAKDYGLDYLSLTLKPFIEELVNNDVAFEVEKSNDIASTDLFMKYLNKLVDAILSSTDALPPSFEFICTEIYRSVKVKFEDAALVAVGSFIFLRFFCPAIISPSTFFNIQNIGSKVKRSLMQLVKVVQNMANGSLGLLKWPGLIHKFDELNDLNRKIFIFLEKVSTRPRVSEVYPFQSIEVKPIPELRYLHKFLYTYFIYIKHQYILTDPLVNLSNLHDRVEKFRKLDRLLREMGQPKALISLNISNSFRNFDPNGSVNHGPFNDFMSRLSMRNVEIPPDCAPAHSAIFRDGTPVVVVNFGHVKDVNYDVEVFVFKLLELASQIWDNKFYMVFDFTGFTYVEGLAMKYVELLHTCGPPILFKNCLRTYYFNIPRGDYIQILKAMRRIRLENNDNPAKIYTYSSEDDPDIINNLCLDDSTLSITKDVRVIFKNVKFYDDVTRKFVNVTLKVGRLWIQICNDFVSFEKSPLFMTKGFIPLEVLKLNDVEKCESSGITGEHDEFSIFIGTYELKTTVRTFRSAEKAEILRFLYFTTSRLSKQQQVDSPMKDNVEEETSYQWFARLYNIVFQGLLQRDEEVRKASAALFASLSTYYDIDFGISAKHAKHISFPSNTTLYIQGVSEYLAANVGLVSYRFFKAFFNNYDKLRHEDKVSAIIYISPWVDNVCDHVYLESDESGPEKVAELVRLFLRITATDKQLSSCLIDFVWKKFFSESRLVTILLDELIVFSVDNEKQDDWESVISIIHPSVEVFGEVMSRLVSAVENASVNDSAVAAQTKLLEILILVKTCASMCFNSYVFAHMFLPDVLFVCTLFIDNPMLNFGADIQQLMLNTIQSFVHTPNISEKQMDAIENTIAYFSGARAKMLFGMTSDRSVGNDVSQIFNRAASFETLCDYLNSFINVLGSSEDKIRWRSRWCSRAVDVTARFDSIFHSRAVLVVGVLSKNGINDYTISRLMKMIGKHPTPALESILNFTVACSRIFEGTSTDSIFPAYFTWVQLTYALLNYVPLYQPTIQCLANIFCKLLEQNVNYLDHLFEARQRFEPSISEFEKIHGLSINKNNFETHLFFIIAQGLKLAQVKHTCLECLKKIFKLRLLLQEDHIPTDVSVPYLFFIYLSSSKESFEEYLAEVDLKLKYVSIKNAKIPRIFVDLVESESDTSKIMLLQAAYFYSHDGVDKSFKNKFLEFYSYLFRKHTKISLSIYHIIKPTLSKIFARTNNLETVSLISDIEAKIISNAEYDPDHYIKQEQEALQNNRCQLIKKYANVFNNDFHEQFLQNGNLLKELVYRAATAYVEGHRLED